MHQLPKASRPVHAVRPAHKRTFGRPATFPASSSPASLLFRNCCCQCQAEEEEVKTELERIIRRKTDEIQNQIDDLGLEWLEEKLRDSVDQHARLPEELQFGFGRLLTDAVPQRKVLLVAEVPRKGLPAEAPEQLAQRAALLAKQGVDSIAVHTDADETPCGLRDLFAVVRAVPETPVFRRDWFIHPLQIQEGRNTVGITYDDGLVPRKQILILKVVETKEAGASGVLGVITQVSGEGTPILSSFAATLGIDAPVEVINQMELDYLVERGVPILAMACSIGLSVTLPGYSKDVSKGLLPHLPPSCASVVGVDSVEAAREAAEWGASALLLKASMLEGVCDDELACREFIQDIKYQISGDD